MENQIWTLLARKFSGEATPEESRLLRKLLEEDRNLAEIVNNISADWYNPGSTEMQKALSSFSKIDAKIRQGHYTIISEQKAGGEEGEIEPQAVTETEIRTEAEMEAATIDQPRQSFFRTHGYTLLKVAACLIVLCGAGLFLFRQPAKKAASPGAISREIAAPASNIRHVELADGSTIWLNEGSSIRLNDRFNVKRREVWLIGEAYFDVTKNKNVPFIIHAGKVNIKVLGTTFNVKSYPKGKSVETSLLRGSVEITLDDKPDAKYILKPNQKLVIPVEETENSQPGVASEEEQPGISFSALSKVPNGPAGEIIAEVSWKERKLAFYETSFTELAEQLEKRFNVPIVFKNEEVKNLVFTGVFNKETLAQALHALSLSAAFRYRIEADKVIVF